MMFRVVVRAKRDADAVTATLIRFFKGWNLEVRTLGGARSKDEVLSRLESIIDENNYYVVLLGREDEHLEALEKFFPDNVVFQLVNKSKVRSARLTEIASNIERGRAKIRNVVGWSSEAYHFTKHAGEIIFRLENPAIDVFLGFEGFARILEDILGRIGKCPLIVRDFGGLHHVYSGKLKVAELKIPIKGEKVSAIRLIDDFMDVDLGRIISINEDVIKLHEHISISFLKRYEGVGDVVVPWSGGKDSTCALLLALKVFKDVTAIFVDTGLEFPETIGYIEDVSKKLNVKVEVVYAGIDEEVKVRGLPAVNDRWCTQLKIEALYRAVRKLTDNPLVIVGDRDAESKLRSLRPPARRHEFVFQLAPMKMWPTWMSQLYLIYNGIPLNPLYVDGFYRIGCYICPSLRSWERIVMLRTGRDALFKRLEPCSP